MKPRIERKTERDFKLGRTSVGFDLQVVISLNAIYIYTLFVLSNFFAMLVHGERNTLWKASELENYEMRFIDLTFANYLYKPAACWKGVCEPSQWLPLIEPQLSQRWMTTLRSWGENATLQVWQVQTAKLNCSACNLLGIHWAVDW